MVYNKYGDGWTFFHRLIEFYPGFTAYSYGKLVTIYSRTALIKAKKQTGTVINRNKSPLSGIVFPDNPELA